MKSDVSFPEDANGAEKTLPLTSPSPADLIRANAGRILGDMLDKDLAGLECAGTSIGPYQLCEIIGEGGFGSVWRAEQKKPVSREVALKVIKLGMGTAQVLGRFNQERQALAALDHPNIATLLDAGVGPNGRPYFAMELVRDGTITHWCWEHESTLEERLRLFIQVCQAVQHAHHKGIIHRDIKPSNILINEVDGAPVPKVIDFGIAKALQGGPGSAEAWMTQSDQMLGTPGFMAPEQIKGEGVDTRTDVYSLGALLYELLTGTAPGSQAGLSHESSRRFLTESPLRPSTHVRQIRKQQANAHFPKRPHVMIMPEIDSDLDWITLRALEKDPERRYQSAAELAADVRRFLEGDSVLARPPSLAYTTRRLLSRHRTAFATAALIVCCLLGGSAVALWQARLARRAQRTAEAESRHAQAAEKEAATALLKSTQATAFVNTLLDRVIQEVKNGRNPEVVTAALAGSEQEILKLTNDTALRITLLEKILNIYSTLGESKLAVPLARARYQELARLHGPHSQITLEAELDHHKLVMDFGKRADSPGLLEGLLHRIEQQGGLRSKFWLEVQRTLSRAWIKLDMPDKAIPASEKLLAAANAQKLSARSMVVHQVAHTDSLEAAKRYSEALALLKQAAPAAVGTVHEDRIEFRIVALLEQQKDYPQAVHLLRDKLAREQKKQGPQSPALLPLIDMLSDMEGRNGDHESAITHARLALEIARSQITKNTTGSQQQRQIIVKNLLELADAESNGDKHSVAILHVREALEAAREMNSNSLILQCLRDLADIHLGADDLEASYEVKRECLQVSREHSASPIDMEQDMRDMCLLRLRQQRPQEALALGKQIWSRITAREDTGKETSHRGQVAETLITAFTACKTIQPDLQDPAELPAWQAALVKREEQRKTIRKLRKT